MDLENVLQFPTGPMEISLRRKFNDWVTRMRALGLSDSEVEEELIEAVKTMGGVKHGDTWYVGCLPPDDSASEKPT